MAPSQHEPVPFESWTVADASARLPDLMDRAQRAPQVITRGGKPGVVVVSAEAWGRKIARKGSLADFLLASPLRSTELDVARMPDTPRDLEP
ncbi:type II toxin-antitoxin system Phd/YefM family antitoxin [Xanthobacteraceae bacterium A53D]